MTAVAKPLPGTLATSLEWKPNPLAGHQIPQPETVTARVRQRNGRNLLTHWNQKEMCCQIFWQRTLCILILTY